MVAFSCSYTATKELFPTPLRFDFSQVNFVANIIFLSIIRLIIFCKKLFLPLNDDENQFDLPTKKGAHVFTKFFFIEIRIFD